MTYLSADKCLLFLKMLWKESRGVLFFFLFVLVPFKSSFADWNWVPTGSMNPTIAEGDLIFIDKRAYDYRIPLTLESIMHRSDPGRGDISVLFSPEDNTRLVKRVIGVPGDVLELKNNTLYINGQRLHYSKLDTSVGKDLSLKIKPYAVFASENLQGYEHMVMALPTLDNQNRSFDAVVIPGGKYFVMGDNRDMSKDSRSFGLVDRRLFIGKASHILASFNILDKFQPRMGRFLRKLDQPLS